MRENLKHTFGLRLGIVENGDLPLRSQQNEIEWSSAVRNTPQPIDLFLGFAWALEQFVGFDLEGCGELLDDVDARAVDAAFEQADIGPVDACQVSQFFLREPLGLPVCLQIQREDFPDIHDPRVRLLSSMLPRSILLKIAIAGNG